jgi:hypothetical protein
VDTILSQLRTTESQPGGLSIVTQARDGCPGCLVTCSTVTKARDGFRGALLRVVQ